MALEKSETIKAGKTVTSFSANYWKIVNISIDIHDKIIAIDMGLYESQQQGQGNRPLLVKTEFFKGSEYTEILTNKTKAIRKKGYELIKIRPDWLDAIDI